MALQAYRGLLRAARVAFQGDERVLTAARASIRESFRVNASLESTDPELPGAIKHAEEVAAILRQNIVQGKKVGERYKLRIHEDTERGDNDTVKFPNGQTAKIDGKTCADR
ncbi:Mitochondrial zinc maintenance protein 1, mitochondrial [Daldinia childiae]|uniref:Mitochondrial zinc maintenance protein 1, mitochondrial n=1 Tax=Daldinia childiae TaxID=326645 RepID=UPI0014476CE0|nr:Mitochondrial zinc maintenance protein 1, mitochondrial [Daldinia childiae]KAF3055101.1 Mitochondrial zinc maintenance protein 1, mitochondrial [Daldinia childiae]